MQLKTLAQQCGPMMLPASGVSVPEWMMGAFRRRCISFANGLSDTDTRVFWLQTAGLTIDLRLPLEYAQAEDRQQAALADHEGWYAHSVWDDTQLSWSAGASSLAENRWPEAAELRRIGNCMMEFAPSGAYVEDWRLQNSLPGLLVGLELISEEDLDSGDVRPAKGAVIVAGDYLGYVYQAPGSAASDFITDIALAAPQNTDGEYVIRHSRHIDRVGQVLDILGGFESAGQPGTICQITESGRVRRTYRIDTLINDFAFLVDTPLGDSAQRWFERYQSTLGRYLRRVF